MTGVDKSIRAVADFSPSTLAAIEAVTGAIGVLIHLLGDAITVGSIRSLHPLDRRQISLSAHRAADLRANNPLFVAGVAGVAVVTVAFGDWSG